MQNGNSNSVIMFVNSDSMLSDNLKLHAETKKSAYDALFDGIADSSGKIF